MTRPKNSEFDFAGINHLALVCKDMARTVDFYSGTLGMPLIKTIELPGGLGQHFFFDVGNGDCIAFFWFASAPEAQPGIASAKPAPIPGPSAHGSMNHVAINVPAERIEEYHDRLVAKGIKCTKVVSHDDSPIGASLDITPTTFVRSVYFYDPDGIALEFAAWTRDLPRDGDVKHEAAKASDTARYRALEAAK
jgi:catechol 2,3-dioxygenase-like lactoylglutathione lyase family enzyme